MIPQCYLPRVEMDSLLSYSGSFQGLAEEGYCHKSGSSAEHVPSAM
jgi:hypothetical protein